MGLGPIPSIHPSEASLGVDDPDEAHACFEPIADLGERFTWSVVGREDFDDEVRSERGKATGLRVRESLTADERYVRCAHGVRIGRELESRVAAHHLARFCPLHVLRQEECEVHGHAPVPVARWLADYEDPADELHTLVGNAGPEQLVGRHERRWHTRNVDAFGGHGNGIWRPSLNRVSTDLFAIFGYGARESGSFQQDSPNYRCAVSP